MTTQQVVIQLERAQPGLTLTTPAPAPASVLVAREPHQIPVQLTPGGSALELRPASSPAITAQIAAIAVGPRGPAGPQGPAGRDGVDADRHHVHVQASAASVWIIEHELQKYPAVSIVDSAGDAVEGDVRYEGIGRVVVTFSALFSGRAYLN